MKALIVFPLVLVSFIGLLTAGALAVCMILHEFLTNPVLTADLVICCVVVAVAQWLIQLIDPNEAGLGFFG